MCAITEESSFSATQWGKSLGESRSCMKCNEEGDGDDDSDQHMEDAFDIDAQNVRCLYYYFLRDSHFFGFIFCLGGVW